MESFWTLGAWTLQLVIARLQNVKSCTQIHRNYRPRRLRNNAVVNTLPQAVPYMQTRFTGKRRFEMEREQAVSWIGSNENASRC